HGRDQRAACQRGQRREARGKSAARLQGALLPLREPLEERGDDACKIDVAQVELLLEDERKQQVERPLERIEVELELPDGGARSGTGRAGTFAPGRLRRAYVAHLADASGVTGRGSSGQSCAGLSPPAAA